MPAITLPRPFRNTVQFAARHNLLGIAYVLCLAVMFFSDHQSTARTVFYVLVLPLAGLALFSSLRKNVLVSTVFWACMVYIAGLILASTLQPDAEPDQISRIVRHAALITVFLLTTAFLVASYPRFVAQFFLAMGIAVAASAAINIYFFLAQVAEAPAMSALFLRLTTTLGMPAYANSTNISATYAVFFVGAAATVVNGRLAAPGRLALSAAAAVILVGVVLTQSRSAYLAVLAGSAVLLLALPARTRVALLATGVVAAALVVLAVPEVREVILLRGTSHRLEVWAKFLVLIAQHPFAGYGVYNPIGIVVGNDLHLYQAHNLVLSGWFRGGIVSALAMIAILAGSIWWAWRHWAATGRIVPLAVIVTITTAGMFDYQLLITTPTWPWVTFWLPFGLCAGVEIERRGR